MFEAKNARIISAIKCRRPYWLLMPEDNDFYYALIQVGHDRIPLPVLARILGKEEKFNDVSNLIGYKPKLVLDRDLKRHSSVELFVDVFKTMTESAKSHGGLPSFFVGSQYRAYIYGKFIYGDCRIYNRIAGNLIEVSKGDSNYTCLFTVNNESLESLFNRAKSLVGEIVK